MTEQRGVNKYDNVDVESQVRALYEAHQTLQENDFLYGNEFSAGQLVTVPKSGGVEDLLLQNPADSETYVTVFPAYIVAGARLEIRKIFNVVVNQLGEQIDVRNKRSDLPNDSPVVVHRSNDTKTDADTRGFPRRLVGAQKADTFQVEAEEVMVAPGDNLCIEAVNPSSHDARATLYLDIREIPAEIIESIGTNLN